jgi:predicted TPR repeat methyltransferase
MNLRMMGREEEASRLLERGIEAFPEHAEMRFLLANSYAMQDMRAEAVRQYREVLRLRPDHPGATRALAILQRGQASP